MPCTDWLCRLSLTFGYVPRGGLQAFPEQLLTYKVSATNLALSLKIRALSYASFYFLVLLCMLSLFGISDFPFSVTNHTAVQSTAGILGATKKDSFRPDPLADYSPSVFMNTLGITVYFREECGPFKRETPSLGHVHSWWWEKSAANICATMIKFSKLAKQVCLFSQNMENIYCIFTYIYLSGSCYVNRV